jgi:hypothetical protein
MPADHAAMKSYIRAFNLKGLFTQKLGWDDHNSSITKKLDGQTFKLTAIAEKRGMVVYQYALNANEPMPEYSERRKIESAVCKDAFEHLIVYTRGNEEQIWQWARREKGKPIACREIKWLSDNDGELLCQSLDHIKFSLEEEPDLTLKKVDGRARKAFDVDKVTGKFYDEFKEQHQEFLKLIQHIEVAEDKSWYASVMLNRLMFIYFIQKKGFLDNDKDYLQTRLAAVRKQHGPNEFHRFYRAFLLRLFHEGLGGRVADRAPDLRELIGDVPYLNGGIFALHSLEFKYPGIEIPDDAFDQVFKFFDSYRWHLDDRPLKDDREINPDVLGSIFEKYINQKEMGAYYTKEDITEYICRSTVVPYLLDATRKKCAIAFDDDGPLWRMLVENPKRYIFPALAKGTDKELPAHIAAGEAHIAQRDEWNRPANEEYALPTEIWREVVARRARWQDVYNKLASGAICSVNDFVTYNLDIRQFAQDAVERCEGSDLLLAFWRSLEKLRILDPTVGSGAFLFAALNVLEPLYEACLDRMEAFIDERHNSRTDGSEPFAAFRTILHNVQTHANRKYFVYKSIIVNNLYGVDIMEEATEICKLRLFLKLAAQLNSTSEIEPLPDIDFNIRAGNTLVGYARLEDIRDLMPAESFDFDEEETSEIQTTAREYGYDLDLFRRHELGEQVPRIVTKRDLEDMAGRVKPKVNRALRKLYISRDALNYGITQQRFEQSHSPLHWFIEFPAVMASGGFDVVIGNPPYVSRKVVTQYNLVGYTTGDCPDIYANVAERCGQLCRENGRVGLIVPISLTFSRQFSSLRTELFRYSVNWFSSYDNIPAAVFQGVSQRCTIWLGSKPFGAARETFTSPMRRWRSKTRPALMQTLQYTRGFLTGGSPVSIPKYGSASQASIFALISSSRKAGNRRSPHSSQALFGYSKTARNYVSTFLVEPPCIEASSKESVKSDKIGWLMLPSKNAAAGCLALTCGEIYFWFWLVAGDGFDVTSWIVEDFLAAFNSNECSEFELLEQLGLYLAERRFDALQFKKNAGKYVGS